MAVWTRGSAGGRAAFWTWLAALIDVRIGSHAAGGDTHGVEGEAVDGVDEDLRRDLALTVPERASDRQEAFWRNVQRSRIWPHV